MFAVLHIADFSLQAVLRHEPAVAQRPAALFADTAKKSVVLAANSLARAAGVEVGMSAPQALARCASLLIRAPQPAAESEARAALLAVGFTLSPRIEDTSPGICTIDLKGAAPEKISPTLDRAVAELGTLGLPATAGLAATPLLALYAARAAETHRSRSPPLSRSLLHNASNRSSTQNEKAKGKERENEERERLPPVLHVTDPASFLAPLPLSTADPAPELAEVLAHWGVRTLGDLTVLPRDEIIRRFGVEGLALWQRAWGGAARPLRLVAPPQIFSAAMEFEQEIETLEPLLFILRRFLDRLSLELRASQHVAAEIHLLLRLDDETSHARSFRLPEPTADPEILFRTLHTHLESLQTAASIVAIDLRLAPARPLVRQQDLFETGLRDPHGFAETLARVSVLVGANRVGTPRIEDTHRPDAVQLAAPAAVIAPAASPPLHAPLGLPLRRFRPPLPARVELTENRATYLWTDHVRGEISAQSPPYPSAGDWWQPDRAWQRTEWDIALATGGLYRLLLVGAAYFLEGEYD